MADDNRSGGMDEMDDSADDGVSALDFGSYELGQLGEDIRSIVDIPGAVMQAAKYAILLPILVGVLTWAIFSSRMSTVALVPFSFIALMLSAFGATVLGGFFVARKRLDTVSDASNRVVGVIGDMHADITRIRGGQAETSVQKVAVGLLENAIFPAVFGTAMGAAETAMGPLGSLASQVTKAPMNMVQKSVVAAVEALPDREIGDAAAGAAEASNALADLATDYENVKGNIEGIVAKVSRTALGSVLGFALVASIPLAIWLILGFLLS